MINLKNKDEINAMREAGKIVGGLLDDFILCKIVNGTSKSNLDDEIEKYIIAKGATPFLKGYVVSNKRYEFSSCISINEEIVHGLPTSRELKDGDIVSIDVSIKYKGYCVDAARTYPVGKISPVKQDLINITKESFFKGIEKMVLGSRVGDISSSIQNHVEQNGYEVIRDFCGHGIGKDLHEDPQVLNYGTEGTGPRIEEGMVLAIEPMVSSTTESIVLDDGWTAITADKSPASHYENTVAVVNGRPEILTLRNI